MSRNKQIESSFRALLTKILRETEYLEKQHNPLFENKIGSRERQILQLNSITKETFHMTDFSAF